MSILYKFILAILSVVFFVIALFTYNNIQEQTELLNHELEKRVKLLKNNLTQDASHTIAYYKGEIENDLASLNLSHIKILFSQLVTREDVLGISINNNTHSVHISEGLSHISDVDTLSFSETENNFIVSSPIELSSKWGTLNIVYSLKKLNTEIENAKKDIQKVVQNNIYNAFLLAIFISFIFGTLSYALAIRITKPILFLTQKTNKIANGGIEDCDEMIDVNSNDEVGQLAKAFMLMSKKLKISYTELKKLNETLEKKVEERTEELKLLAVTDSMTQLYNRRYFTSVSNDILMMAKREQQELSLIMIDIDNFKNINDTYGHKTGDDVIIEFAKILKNGQRQSDVICRFGGEEFVILLPKTDIEGAIEVAKHLKDKTEHFSIALENNQTLQFTISLGVASIDVEKELGVEHALQRADKALYEAKDCGRNEICIA